MHSLIISREVLILTLPILPTLQGCISWYIPRDGLMMREWPYTASNRDVLGCTSPPTSRFPSALEMSLGLRPRDISRASGNLLVVGDVQPNTSLLSAVYGYIIEFKAGRHYQILHNTADCILLDLVLKGESISLPYFCKVSIQLPINAFLAKL